MTTNPDALPEGWAWPTPNARMRHFFPQGVARSMCGVFRRPAGRTVRGHREPHWDCHLCVDRLDGAKEPTPAPRREPDTVADVVRRVRAVPTAITRGEADGGAVVEYVRRDAVLQALTGETQDRCPTCGCDRAYPTPMHIVDCPRSGAPS